MSAEAMGIIATIAAVINLGVTIFGGFAFLMAVKSHQAVQDVLLEHISSSLKRLDKTVEDLRRGDGWIHAPPRPHLEGEYPG